MSLIQRTLQLVVLCTLPLFIAACDSGDEPETLQVNIVEVVQLPTLITPVTDTPLPPSATVTTTRTPQPSFTPIQWPTATATQTQTAIPLISLVIAVQPIPSGQPIPPGAIQLVDWPVTYAPAQYFTEVEAVINEVAVVDIGCYEPIVPNGVAFREIGTALEPLSINCPPIDTTAALSLVTVVIARKDIAAGQRIDPDDIAVRLWPDTMLPHETYRNMSDVLGHVALKAIIREQPITSERAAPGG